MKYKEFNMMSGKNKIRSILLFLLLFSQPLYAQTDPDFFKYKKQADDCFAKKDYGCAEQNYKRALVVKANDDYCKVKLNEAVSGKRKTEQRRRAEEQRRLAEEQEAQRQEEALQEQERRQKAERDEQIRVIYEVRKALDKFDTILKEDGRVGYVKPELKKQKWLVDTLLKYQSKSYFWPEAYLTLGRIYWSYFIPRETLSLEPLEYFKKALPLPEAYFGLGRLYEFGRGVSKDNQKASEYYLAGAQLGHTGCMNDYADLKLRGDGITQDIQEALYWYKQSAEKGSTWAMQTLGVLYYSGEYIAKDYVSAFEWFDKSNSEQYSQSFLAKMYYYGQGIDVNYEKAFEYANLTSSYADSKLILALILYKDRLSELRKFDSFFEKMKVIEEYLQKSKAEGNETAKKYELYYGNIVDFKTNKPLPGANVMFKGTQRGQIANSEGNFSILNDSDHNRTEILVFSHAGYKPSEVVFTTNTGGVRVALKEKW